MAISSLDSSKIQPQDFDDDGWIENVYLPELHRCVCQALRSIWKPLSGPCRDFPLAFLDPLSVDRDKDLFKVDEVFPTVANEVFQVYHSPNHLWYYIPDQQDSEVAIFNAFDSEKGQSLAVPHCSFDLGDARSRIPRQSIEVRAFVFC